MRMTPDELLVALESYRANSLGRESTDLSNERAEAHDRYHGRPYGDEREGHSQVVSRDMADTISWIMPDLLDIFIQSGEIATFDPVGQEDEQAAAQESEVVNQQIMKKNNGVILVHDYCKEALMLKNAYIKVRAEEYETIVEHDFSGLNSDELAKLMMDLQTRYDEVEVLEQDESTSAVHGFDGQLVPIQVYEIKVRGVEKRKRVVVEGIPVEEVRVSRDCRGSTNEAKFIEHETTKTRTELIEMGMDADFVLSLPAHDDYTSTVEAVSRNSVADENNAAIGPSSDSSTDDILYREAYVLVDWDGDGKAERRRIITVGEQLPEGDEWNEVVDSVGIIGGSAMRIPHRHIGESINDILDDLARIKTALLRQALDNTYQVNNQQYVINERAHLPDFLRSMAGGLKRVAGRDPVEGSVMAMPIQPILGAILPAVDYIDKIKDTRTGVSEATTGVSPDVLKEANNGVYSENLSKANRKVKLMARLLAEGLKEVVLRVHELMIKHQDKAETYRLRSGRYVSVNPMEWKNRTDLTVSVGLGATTQEEKKQALGMIGAAQDRAAAMGLVGPVQAYNYFSDTARAWGYEIPDKYVLNPQSPEFQQMMQAKNQHPPNPLAEVEHIKQQANMQINAMRMQHDAQIKQMQEENKRQIEAAKQEINHQHEMHKLQAETFKVALENASRETIEAAKLEIQAMLAGIRVDLGKPGIGAGLQEQNQ